MRPPKVPEISPQDLASIVESGAPIQILDVRAPARVAGGRIDIVNDDQFHNIVGSRLVTMRSPHDIGLNPSIPVVVVCGHGNSSKPATAFLNEIGYEARSVRGGMAAWMLLTIPRELPTSRPLDRLIQFDRVGKGALGYLLVSDGEALIVDPPRATTEYLEALRDTGARLVGVADTHCHADYISGAFGLAQSHGVPYYLHPRDAIYPYDGTPGQLVYQALEDGAALRIGRSVVRVVHNPGHTEGSVTYLVDDAVALTGDFLFVASVGRPDLAGKTKEWTGELWRSIEKAKRSWPKDLWICPGHYGSESDRSDNRSVCAQFGELLRDNEALTRPNSQAFAQWVESQVASFPDSYRKIKAINVGLVMVDELEAEELEVGRNECALGGS